MSDVLLTLEPWRQLFRARGMALVVRLLVVLSPIAAAAFTMLGGKPFAPVVIISIVGIGALLCAAAPDSHAGIAMVLFLAVLWLALVDDLHTPWAIGAGASLAVFHWAMAAAGASPAAARWTSAMTRRWISRGLLVLPSVVATWALVATLQRRTGSGTVVVVAALSAIAAAALWIQRHDVTDAADAR